MERGSDQVNESDKTNMHLAFETPSKIDKYQVVVEVLSG
jgi:hypothetical protein